MIEPIVLRGHARTRSWTRVTHGVHRASDVDDAAHAELLAWQSVLPEGGCFTHLTAAGLHGWWLPELPDGLPVLAAGHRDGGRPQRAGIRFTRHPDPPTFVVRDGLRVATPGETLLACARDLSPLDLVVVVDGALAAGVDHAEIEVAAGLRRRGAPALRTALALADRSESAWESVLRMLHHHLEAPVEPQYDVVDNYGDFVARADLWLVGTRMIHEYDGADHLARLRQRKDLRRSRRLTAAGWSRRGYTAVDVVRQPDAVARDVDATLQRRSDPDRVRRWRTTLRTSTATASGKARLLERLAAGRRT